MLGTLLGHYRLIRELEQGGTATVFLAEDIHLQRQVAVKVFDSDLDTNAQQNFLSYFAREARTLASLDHPNILPVYDYGEQDGHVYLVMPYIAGGSLRDYLRQRPLPISPEQAVSFLQQVLLALEYAHARGLIHRDIKPGNILFKNDKTLLLSDFGLVKIVEKEAGANPQQDMTQSGGPSLKGTPSYIAPEQIHGRPAQSSDIYSLGVVAYELLTGQRPFQAEDTMAVLFKHLHERPRPLRELNPALSLELESVVLQALAKEPEQRFQSATTFRTALGNALKTTSHQVQGSNMPMADMASHTHLSSPYQTQLAGQTEHTITPQGNASNAFHSSPKPSGSISTPATQFAFQRQATITPQSSPPPGINPTHGAPPRPRGISKWNILTYILIGATLATSIFAILYNAGYLGKQQTPSPSTQATATPSQSVPATITTACPPTNKARPATLHPMTLGSHHQLIYIVNEGPNDAPTAATLKRRDADTNNKATSILQIPNVHIDEGQITQNGQWVLFTLSFNGISQVRMARVDGQEQQTLYCAPSDGHIADSQLSINGQKLIFNLFPGPVGKPSLNLLDLTTGSLTRLLEPTGQQAYTPTTWQDKSHVYLTSFVPNSDVPRTDLYLLNVDKGANQKEQDMSKVLSQDWTCGSFDDSFDSRQLFVASCGTNQGTALPTPTGPTTISIQPATGGTAHTIAHIDQAVTMLRTISSTTLLYMVENGSGDSSQNGLWRMNIDGTNRQRLSTDATGGQSLSLFSHYTWANVSTDGKLFALQEADPQSQNRKMYYGNLTDGVSNFFADISDGTDLRLVGWTHV
ncbi:serine/threonine protein kinase [Ktedonospora formicarum]|uniref:non-specific serine/threonine protein kinase n=1 Tax=Ktedonospora formicarum TaxID=2778364 RepID=A0A8J3HSP3_9CHLR|nr:serine/threonine-protein kinase [Ktedonospora formicarum]GHO43247.1 hypothetical protein KSX_14100 [Ktedonospora formicarum]